MRNDFHLILTMVYLYKGKALDALMAISTDFIIDEQEFENYQDLICIHWNRGKYPIPFSVDGIPYILLPNQITTTTFLHKKNFGKDEDEHNLTTFLFNKPFYCIIDHDEEVSCNGIIFLGTQQIPIVTLSAEEVTKFNILYQVFIEEFNTKDNIQGEMLQMLLKRMIIKVTRLAKEQLITPELNEHQVDLVRKFNFLVDIHFREKKQVNDYAALLFKSPKTLSNLFAKYNQKTPLQIIHDRIVLEGMRLLHYTDKSVKEIAHELGFDNVGGFHKIFKKVTSQTPQSFKLSQKQ